MTPNQYNSLKRSADTGFKQNGPIIPTNSMFRSRFNFNTAEGDSGNPPKKMDRQ